MFKTINKFSKLTVLFTAVYILLGIVIVAYSLSTADSMDWILKSLHPFGVIYSFFGVLVVYFITMILSVVYGVLSIVKTYKTEEKWKKRIYSLTIFNILVLVIHLVIVIGVLASVYL